MQFDPNRMVGAETSKTYRDKIQSGFWQCFIGGPDVLEIGFRGHTPGHLPLTEGATGVDLDFPGYDGRVLPFKDNLFDAVYSSHVLEHINDWMQSIREWHRVTKLNGHIITVVPHAYLYERTVHIPPSQWNGDHKRAYTPGSLMDEFEKSLRPNTYRVRHLIDNDHNYAYGLPVHRHPEGCYEIELVIQKVNGPAWFVGA
jgi:SAM-dependent methyltransferase